MAKGSIYRRYVKDESGKKVLESKTWYYRIRFPDGSLERKSCETEKKELAEMFFKKKLEQAFKKTTLHEKPAMSLADARDKWLIAKRREKVKSVDDYERQLAWWLSTFKAMTPAVLTVRDVTKEAVRDALNIKRLEPDSGRSGGFVTEATVNRYKSALRALLNHIREEYDDGLVMPVGLKAKKGSENGRVRWLKPEEFKRLVMALPEHYRAFTLMAVMTGQREANILQLQWDQVDMERGTVFYSREAMKNGNEHAIPLSAEAWGLLRAQLGKHKQWVFIHTQGENLKFLSNRIWKGAVRRAGLENVRFHDMRHTWASHMAQNGVGLQVLQALGAWKSASMVQRYAHLAVDALRPHAAVIDKAMAGIGGLILAGPANDVQDVEVKVA